MSTPAPTTAFERRRRRTEIHPRELVGFHAETVPGLQASWAPRAPTWPLRARGSTWPRLPLPGLCPPTWCYGFKIISSRGRRLSRSTPPTVQTTMSSMRAPCRPCR